MRISKIVAQHARSYEQNASNINNIINLLTLEMQNHHQIIVINTSKPSFNYFPIANFKKYLIQCDF